MSAIKASFCLIESWHSCMMHSQIPSLHVTAPALHTQERAFWPQDLELLRDTTQMIVLPCYLCDPVVYLPVLLPQRLPRCVSVTISMTCQEWPSEAETGQRLKELAEPARKPRFGNAAPAWQGPAPLAARCKTTLRTSGAIARPGSRYASYKAMIVSSCVIDSADFTLQEPQASGQVACYDWRKPGALLFGMRDHGKCSPPRPFPTEAHGPRSSDASTRLAAERSHKHSYRRAQSGSAGLRLVL
jgi:hypothetical protein